MGVYEKFYADKRIRFGLDRCQDDEVDESVFDPDDARANTVTLEDETELSLDTAADSASVDQSSVAPLPGSAPPSETAPSPDIETAADTEPAPDIETAADTEPAPDTAAPSPELTPLLDATLSPNSALSSYSTQRSDSADLPETMPPNDTTNGGITDFTASPQVSPPSTEPPPAKRCKPDDKNDENQVKNVVASIKSTTKFIVVPSFDPLACRVCKSKTPVPMSCSKCGLHVHLGCTLPLLSAKIKIKNLPLICRLCKVRVYFWKSC